MWSMLLLYEVKVLKCAVISILSTSVLYWPTTGEHSTLVHTIKYIYTTLHQIGMKAHSKCGGIAQCGQRTRSFLAKAQLHATKSQNTNGSVVQHWNHLAIGVLSLLSTVSQLNTGMLVHYGNIALGRCLETKYSILTQFCLLLYFPLDPSLVQYFL